jgi:hypothetical protein
MTYTLGTDLRGVTTSLSPLWGSFISRLFTHGLRRGLHSFAALRLGPALWKTVAEACQ